MSPAARPRPVAARPSRAALALVAAVAACAPAAPAATPTPAAGGAPPALPPIPRVEGPLRVRVVYPAPNALVATRDSNFIFGSVGHGDATLRINGHPVPVEPNGSFLAFLPVPSAPTYDLVARLGADSARVEHPVRLLPPPAPAPAAAAPRPVADSAPPPPSLVRLGAPPAADSGDARIVARPTPGGTYRWFLVPGTVVLRTGRTADFARVRLADDLEAWVSASDVQPLDSAATAAAAAPRVAGDVAVRSADGWADVVVPMRSPAPYLVEQRDDALVLTLYGTTANTSTVRLGSDALVRAVTWAQRTGGRAEYTVALSGAPYGYQTLWRDGTFVLRVRRPPTVDARRPLAGLRIAVDPGHPPVGATGPTGLYEAEMTLAVGERLRAELERRGAVVVMTRATAEPVGLAERPATARRADAHAFVSIHGNALPDGVNPFGAHGTSTYYFHPHSAPLARAVQDGMLRRMGLRDLGTFYGNLAVVRGTWMPSVLAEGAFMMIPAQEAALRTPEFQQAYANGVADGLEAYFRALGAGEARP
jgi:N-acetylmuramoyl-L-alanine amidase